MTDKKLLKEKIISTLEEQGFDLDGNKIVSKTIRKKCRM